MKPFDFLILGSGIGGLHEIEEGCFKLHEKGPDRVSPFVVPKMMLNAAGGNISIRYGLRGINYSVATACASANNAIGDALQAIQRGSADVVITGGTESAITQVGLAGFQNMKALSTRNDDPQRASRPNARCGLMGLLPREPPGLRVVRRAPSGDRSRRG